jgi:hypothetical protein
VQYLKSGQWYAFDASDTFGYGPVTGQFRPTRELKMIDITSHDFYINYVKDLNALIHMNPHLEDRRGFLLFPVGFQDGITYRELARHLSIDVAPHIDLGLSISSQFYNNRGRCSIKQLDEDFIQILKILYGSKNRRYNCSI